MAFEDEIAKLGGVLTKPPVYEATPEAITQLGGTITKTGKFFNDRPTVAQFEEGLPWYANSEFSRGAARGATNMASSGLDFARIFSDSPRLKAIADEMASTAEHLPTKVASVRDVLNDPTLAPAYIGKVTGELAPQAVAAYLTGGAGRAIGRGVGLGTTGLRIATGAGAAATSIPQEAGGIFRETEELTGKGSGAAALGYGIPAGMLDAMSAEFIIGKVFRGGASEEVKRKAWREVVRDALKEVPKAAGFEAGTESAQESLALLADKSADATFELLTPENGWRVLESAVAGAIGGGLLGGSTEVASLPAQRAARSERASGLRSMRRERDSLRSRYQAPEQGSGRVNARYEATPSADTVPAVQSNETQPSPPVATVEPPKPVTTERAKVEVEETGNLAQTVKGRDIIESVLRGEQSVDDLKAGLLGVESELAGSAIGPSTREARETQAKLLRDVIAALENKASNAPQTRTDRPVGRSDDLAAEQVVQGAPVARNEGGESVSEKAQGKEKLLTDSTTPVTEKAPESVAEQSESERAKAEWQKTVDAVYRPTWGTTAEAVLPSGKESSSERLPRSIVEAVAANKPVKASELQASGATGIAGYIRDGEYFVPAKNLPSSGSAESGRAGSSVRPDAASSKGAVDSRQIGNAEAGVATGPEPGKLERVLIGKSPQPYTVLERLKADEIEIQNGEQPVRVKNEKTGEVSVVLAAQTRAIKPKPSNPIASSEDTAIIEASDESPGLPLGNRSEDSSEAEEGYQRGVLGQMPVAAMAEDLQRSGRVLRGSKSEIYRELPLARGTPQRTDVRKETTGAESGRDGAIHLGSEPSSREVSEGARVFIETPAAQEIPITRRNIDILAHGILFGSDKKAGTGTILDGLDFARTLASDRLVGLRILFEQRSNGKPRADYIPRRANESFDTIRVNTSELSRSDLTNQADLDLWTASIVEEVLHAATFRVSSMSDLKGVWDSLSAAEKQSVEGIYANEISNDAYKGAEYIRMVLQERLFGYSTEIKKRTISEKVRAELRKLLSFLMEAFGRKPKNNTARQIVERIEGAIKGDAPIEQSIFDDSESIGASPDRPLNDLLQGKSEDTENYISTEVFGVKDFVLDRESFTPEQQAKSRSIAKAAYDEAGINVTMPEDADFWRIVDTGKEQNPAGRRLIAVLKRELEKYGAGAVETSVLVNSIVDDFKSGSMDKVFSAPIRNELYQFAQGDRSHRGVALAALRGANRSLNFVSQNIDVVLKRTWHEAFGGKEIDSVLSKIRDKFKAFFTPEVVAEIVKANPLLGRVKNSAKIIQDGLDTEFANLNELRDWYLEALVKADVEPKQAAALAREIVVALKPRIRVAAGEAANGVEGAMTPDERTVTNGKKPIWQMLVEMVQRGEFDNGILLREKAAKNGWRPPNDAEIARIKRLAERERELTRLSKKELEAAKGDKDKLAREQVVRDEATLPSRLPLMRQMEAAWGSITRPVNLWKFFGSNRANNAAFINELVSANLLLRLSFAPKQAISVISQFAYHMPTRAIGQALELHAQAKTLEQQTALTKDVYNSLTGAFKSAIAGYKDGATQFVAALRGRGEARNVDRLMSGIAAIERIDAQAHQYAEQGRWAMANLYRFFGLIRLGYRIAQAFDNLHGVPSEYIEMRHQAVRELMRNGKTRTEANTQADNIITAIKASSIQAVAEAKAFLDANGMEYTSQTVSEISHRIARRWAYETMRSMGLDSDDFIQNNKQLRETLGWNEREVGIDKGIGGVMGAGVAGFGKAAEKIGIPLAIGRFSNAIAIGINRALHFTPLGFFPEAFGGANNAWFRTELDRNQRKVEAALGSTLGSIAFMLALSGVFIVRLKWPRDPEERDLWEAEGRRPGTIEIPNGDGTFSAVSMNTGPMAFLAPYLAAGGALRDKIDEREKAQQKLNEEAARKGVTPETIRPMSMADLAGVAVAAGYQTVLGGRTSSGIAASLSDYGNLNVTKTVASQAAPLVPLLPAMQEISRMSGVVLDSKLATFGDFLLPLPSSPARRVNFLGDPAGTPNDVQRIVQTLTGGTFPNIDPSEARNRRAYEVVFASGARPPSISPNKGYVIGDAFRPFTDAELERYSVERGNEFKAAMAGLPADADANTVKAAFKSANLRALQRLGVTVKEPKISSRVRRSRRSGLRRSRIGLRSLRSTKRKGLRSLRFQPARLAA